MVHFCFFSLRWVRKLWKIEAKFFQNAIHLYPSHPQQQRPVNSLSAVISSTTIDSFEFPLMWRHNFSIPKWDNKRPRAPLSSLRKEKRHGKPSRVKEESIVSQTYQMTQKFLPSTSNCNLLIECVRSCDQKPYLHNKTKDGICIKIEFNSQKNISLLQDGHRFFVYSSNMAAVTSREHTLLWYGHTLPVSDVANPSERTKTGLLTVLHTKMSDLEARTNMHGDFELQTKQRKQNETKIKRFRRDTSQGRVVRSSVSAEPGSTS